MIIQYENIKLNVEHLSEFDNSKKTILFLHGFTGSSNDWKDVVQKIDKRFNKTALDLIGHGKSSSPTSVNYYMGDSLTNQIEQVINHLRLKEVILCGYSMGGRVALNFAIAKPNMVKGLILESSSPGIKNQKEKEARKKSDEELAAYIENNSLEDFAAMWLDQELFGTLRRFSNNKLKDIKEEKAKNSKIGLANSLRGFGTGVMPFLASELVKLKIPTFLITGGLDDKFTQINQNFKKLSPSVKHKIISTSGHNTHLEEPKKFIDAVNGFLSGLR
ncbi:MAG: 2-succinyl-6-hydroxy-2,4-cyclohexadiene-1-carboxylate synthase [Ignavibacteriaceae bacterium]|nr:2-succinyl-6-hydroxy-2,4-cyclohexadiene-1-carboxylate synthase [Ignavibacteriaceae bacterium]